MSKIRLRRGTAAEWTSADPILLVGEPGYETDTGNLKVGDGSTAWTGLSYYSSGAPVTSVFGRTGAVTSATNDYSEAQISFTDLTTNDVSTSKHGFAPKAPNDATKFLNGAGAYSQPTGASPGAGGTSRLYEYEVTGSDKASIDTNVDGTTVANFSGYDILEIWFIGRTDEAGITRSNGTLQFNNDSSGNYYIEQLRGLGTGVAAAGSTGGTSFTIELPGNSNTASHASIGHFSIPGYTGTTFFKTVEMLTGYTNASASSCFASDYIGTWASTSAITRVKLACLSTNKLKVGSKLIVYGR